MRKPALALLVFSLVPLASGQPSAPKNGYVPNEDTATAIAEAVLIPAYGKDKILSERPFTARLKAGVWTVSGTLRCPDGRGGTTTSCVGGVAVVEISKADARICR
jgi:hypothetical protein